MPIWIELLLWLALLVVDGTLALRDLLGQRRRRAIQRSRSMTGQANRPHITTWLAADLNPASLA
jgi:hypothetical protein